MSSSSLIRSLFRNIIHTMVSAFNALSSALSRTTGEPYQLTLPFATYAPWLRDQEFLKLFDDVRADCLTNLFQSWELWTLGQQLGRSEGDFLEVGVWRGGSSAILGKAMQKAGSNGTLYCCDSFSGLVKTSAKDPHNTDGELSDADPADVRAKMERLGIQAYEVLVGVFPDETGEQLADKEFSLVHIDVDAKKSAQGVFDWVWPRMVLGGIVIFQDYGFHRTPGISELVDQLRGRQDLTVIHNLNGNALVLCSGKAR